MSTRVRYDKSLLEDLCELFVGHSRLNVMAIPTRIHAFNARDGFVLNV